MSFYTKKILKIIFSSTFLVFFACCFVSCKNYNQSKSIIYIPDSDTVRHKVNSLIENSFWTEEIQKSSKDKSSTNSNKNNVFIPLANVSSTFQVQKDNNPVYPELKDFYSLNLSSLDFNTKSEITKLINKIKEENITKSDFLSDYQHEKILFDYEFSKHPQITGYYLGTPLEQSENHILIPVQFLFSTGKLNSKIFFEKKENTFKIKQIVFGEYIGDQ